MVIEFFESLALLIPVILFLILTELIPTKFVQNHRVAPRYFTFLLTAAAYSPLRHSPFYLFIFYLINAYSISPLSVLFLLRFCSQNNNT